MDIEALRAYCAQKKGITREFPFGNEVEVFKVMGRMFALIPTDGTPRISLKCEPRLAVMLRDTYPAVQPGWFRQHWNSIILDDSIPDSELYEMIDHSYEQAVKALKKSDREKLKQAEE